MSIRQTLALLAGLAALKALPVAGEEYRTLARLTDLFKRDPSRAAALVPTDRQRPSTSGPSRSLARVASLAWRFAKVHTGSRTERRSPGTQAAAEPGRNYTTKWPCGWDHISPHNRHAVGSRRRSSCSS